MAGEPILRRLIRGPSLSVFSRSSLWLTEDHLLSVEQRGNREQYRRFYFDDIGALIVRATPRRSILAGLFGIWMVLGLLLLGGADMTEWKMFGGIVAGFFGILSAINLVKGPGCVCHVQTSVSCTQLQAIKRLNKVDIILPKLRGCIAEAQGEKSPDEMVAAIQARMSDISAAPAVPSGQSGRRAGNPERPGYSGFFHLGLFSLLLADAFLVLVTFGGSFPVLLGLRMLFVLTALFFAAVALARYGKARISSTLWGATLAAAIYLGVWGAAIYGLFVAVQLRNPEVAGNTMLLLRILAESNPYDGMGWLLFFAANAGISGILGAFGLLHALRFRGQNAPVRRPLPSIS